MGLAWCQCPLNASQTAGWSDFVSQHLLSAFSPSSPLTSQALTATLSDVRLQGVDSRLEGTKSKDGGVDFTPSPRRGAQAGRKPCNAIVYQGSAIWNKGDVDKVSQNETDR